MEEREDGQTNRRKEGRQAGRIDVNIESSVKQTIILGKDKSRHFIVLYFMFSFCPGASEC